MNILTEADFISLCGSKEQFLLINAPAVDIRLPWARWQQPTGLLKIGSWLKEIDKDVRLIDCLQVSTNNRLKRKKIGEIVVEGHQLNLWHFGLSPSKVVTILREWQKQDWNPEVIFISCGMSFWWRGVRDLIQNLKETFQIPIIIGGAYPTFYPEHAAIYTGADNLYLGDVSVVNNFVTDLNLYAPRPLPRFAGISLLHPSGILPSSSSPRDPVEIADEVQTKARQGVTTFAFYDPWLGPQHRQPLTDALAEIASRQIPIIRFIAPGNFSPRLINEDLAIQLKRLRFKHIYLHDDIHHSPNEIKFNSNLDDYRKCMQYLHLAKFRPRTDEVGAAVKIGIPGENLDKLTHRLIQLSSIVGSLHLVPFQFTHGTVEGKAYEITLANHDGHFDLTNNNGRIFPLVRREGAKYEDYLEITRLVTLLNSKFRSRTFNFLGSSLTAQLVRKSLREQLWNPFSEDLKYNEQEQDKFIHLPIKE